MIPCWWSLLINRTNDEESNFLETKGHIEKGDSTTFHFREVLRRELEKIDPINSGNLQEIAPEDKGSTTSKEIAAPGAEAERDRPKKGTRMKVGTNAERAELTRMSDGSVAYKCKLRKPVKRCGLIHV